MWLHLDDCTEDVNVKIRFCRPELKLENTTLILETSPGDLVVGCYILFFLDFHGIHVASG